MSPKLSVIKLHTTDHNWNRRDCGLNITAAVNVETSSLPRALRLHKSHPRAVYFIIPGTRLKLHVFFFYAGDEVSTEAEGDYHRGCFAAPAMMQIWRARSQFLHSSSQNTWSLFKCNHPLSQQGRVTSRRQKQWLLYLQLVMACHVLRQDVTLNVEPDHHGIIKAHIKAHAVQQNMSWHKRKDPVCKTSTTWISKEQTTWRKHTILCKSYCSL